MGVFTKFRNFLRAPSLAYKPLIEVRVFRSAILHNLHEFQTHYPQLSFAPVLKSNAYGHGLIEVAKIVDQEKLAFMVVDSFYEAVVLRNENIKSKILVIGYATQEQILKDSLPDCAFTITNLDQLKVIAAELSRPRNFHLKIDTGMARQGIWPDEIETAITLIKSNENLVLEGICMHFADAKNTDSTYTDQQISVWNSAVAQIKKHFPQIKYVHAASTAGTYYSDKIEGNVARIGIGLYGLDNAPKSRLTLEPALEMWSVVSLVKQLPAGHKVGYAITYESPSPKTIAVMPVGYNEGVDRRLSNKGCVQINGVNCPIIGRVSMNMTTIDVSSASEVKLESQVLVLSRNRNDLNSLENIAEQCECIPHEILVHIPAYLRRTVI